MIAARRRRRGGPPTGTIIALIVGVLAVALLGWWLLRDRTPPESVQPTPPPAATDPADPVRPPALDLPELDASDEFVRQVVAGLSSRPQLAAWLAHDALIHRFTRVVVDLAGGSNPAAEIPFLRPDQPFEVREVQGMQVIAPESYRRYDLLAAVFASLDTRGTVRLYRQLYPLIDEAYRDLGLTEPTFDETLRLAIRNLLAVQVPDRPLEVEPDGGIWIYSDPALEDRRGAAKALTRMGPQNAARVQAKLRELAHELGMEP